MDLMPVYNRLPVFLQNAAVSAEGWRIQKTRYGKKFDAAYKAFMERNTWSYEQKCAYRDKMLQRMVEHCYKTVPYYHRLFDELKIDYREIRTLDDLRMLPILDKKTVKENFDEFISTDYRRQDMIIQHTSGSTGAGFIFYMTKEAYAAEWANGWRGNHNIGVERGTWCGYFAGRTIVPKTQNTPPYYRINKPGKQIMFSAYHMRPEVLSEYVDVLNTCRPPWIHAYPSSLVPLAKFILEEKKILRYKPSVITLASENVHEWQERLIEQAFGVLPIQNYAQTEAVATFRQRCDRRIIVDEDFSAVEFLPVENSGSCRIIGTTLSNYGMPFLRYDTKDFATYEENEYGRQILSLDGRQEDVVKIKDGSVLGRLDHLFKDQVGVAEAQLVQKSLDELEVHIVKAKRYSEADEKRLQDVLDSYLGGKIGYKILYDDCIPKGKNGKLRFVISEI